MERGASGFECLTRRIVGKVKDKMDRECIQKSCPRDASGRLWTALEHLGRAAPSRTFGGIPNILGALGDVLPSYFSKNLKITSWRCRRLWPILEDLVAFRVCPGSSWDRLGEVSPQAIL